MPNNNISNKVIISSFTCKVLITEDEAYIKEPSPQMFAFFGTNEESYRNGMLRRIRNDIGDVSADALKEMLVSKARKGEEFRLVYPSMRADGSACTMQMDAYPRENTPEGRIFDVIEMDITDLLETVEREERLSEENHMLTEDSPVGLGIYHIKDDRFDLVYTNNEYYKVHCGSREYWDSFNGREATERILPEDRPAIYAKWLQVKEHPGELYDATYRCLGEDGKVHWIRLMARFDDHLIDGYYRCYASYLNLDKEKEAEERAKDADRMMVDTINNLPSISALFRVSDSGHIKAESYSEEFCRMIGRTQKDIFDFYSDDAFYPVHPDDRDKLKLIFNKHSAGRSPISFAYRILTASGKYMWVSVNAVFFTVSESEYMYVNYTDIDQIKAQESILDEQYNNWQIFLDSISDTYLTAMRINFSQNKIELINGVAPIVTKEEAPTYDALMQKFIEKIPRMSDRKKLQRVFSTEAVLEKFSKGEAHISMEYIIRPDTGGAIWIEDTVNLMRRPGSDDIIGFNFIHDINRPKITEVIVDKVLINQYDFISSIDVDKNTIDLVSVNHQSAAITEVHGGQDYDGIMRTYVDMHVVPEEKQICIDFMTLSNVTRLLDKNGTCSKSFHVIEGGELRNKRLDYYYIDRESRLVSLIRTDFTKMQEQQLKQEEKLRNALAAARQASIAKSEFLSRMSHEIRTPMNAIIGLDTIALQEQDLSSAMEDHLKKIGISARFLLSLINDILDMSRIESGKMLLRNDEFDFRSLIDSIDTIMTAQCYENGIDYDCIIKGYTEEAYRGDQTKLQQVLLNILGNSVKFTPSGGKIHFMIEQISHDKDNAVLRFTIADTGQGIDEAFLPHIFDTFTQEEGGSTTTYGGTGLGLAISKSLVELMDGSIDVHSIKDMGTDFTVEVKLGMPDESGMLSDRIVPPDMLDLKTLIVDDDVTVCQHTEIVLRQAGFDAEWVTSGYDAVNVVKKRNKESNNFDLILLDWKMPDMDGLETARQIRKIVGPEVTIIILTAYDWSEIEQKAKEAGIDNFMRKPVFASSVIEIFSDTRRGAGQHSNGTAASYDFSGRKILVVEDNIINAEIEKHLLEMVGFSVDTARNGVDAIQAFTVSKVGEYSAILMDIRMPFMDGLEATRTIRQIKKQDAGAVPIIAMSANAFAEDIEKSMDSGMNAHLSKPIEPEILYRTLHELIRKQ